MFFTGYGTVELFVYLPMTCVNTAIPDPFVMLFWDMFYETLYEFHNRDSFLYIGIILMAVVVEGNKVTILFVNSGGGNDWASQIAPHVFYGSMGSAFVRLGVYVKAILMFPVTAGLNLFERRTDFGF